jgi:hypothetical protein
VSREYRSFRALSQKLGIKAGGSMHLIHTKVGWEDGHLRLEEDIHLLLAGASKRYAMRVSQGKGKRIVH